MKLIHIGNITVREHTEPQNMLDTDGDNGYHRHRHMSIVFSIKKCLPIINKTDKMCVYIQCVPIVTGVGGVCSMVIILLCRALSGEKDSINSVANRQKHNTETTKADQRALGNSTRVREIHDKFRWWSSQHTHTHNLYVNCTEHVSYMFSHREGTSVNAEVSTTRTDDINTCINIFYVT